VSSTSRLRQILDTAGISGTLSAAERDALAGVLRCRDLELGDVLYKQGQAGDSMAVVVDGALAVRVGDAEVARLKAGAVVGEMSCLCPGPRSATVAARSPSVVAELDRSMLLALQQNAPETATALVRAVVSQLTDRLHSTTGHVQELLGKSPSRSAPAAGEGATPGRVSRAAGRPCRGPLNLAGIPAHVGFSAEELETLADAASAREYGDGELICVEGEPGDSCYLVVEGTVDVLRGRGGGAEILLGKLRPGSFVGRMLLLKPAPRFATIRAHGATVVLEIRRDAFEAMLAARSPLAVRLYERAAAAGIRQLRAVDGMLQELVSATRGSARRQTARAALQAPPVRTENLPFPSPRLDISEDAEPRRERREEPPPEPRRRSRPMPSVFKAPAEAASAKKRPQPKPAADREKRPTDPDLDRLMSTGRALKTGSSTKRGSGWIGKKATDDVAAAFLTAALSEWDMPVEELGKAKAVESDGVTSREQKKKWLKGE